MWLSFAAFFFFTLHRILPRAVPNILAGEWTEHDYGLSFPIWELVTTDGGQLGEIRARSISLSGQSRNLQRVATEASRTAIKVCLRVRLCVCARACVCWEHLCVWIQWQMFISLWQARTAHISKQWRHEHKGEMFFFFWINILLSFWLKIHFVPVISLGLTCSSLFPCRQNPVTMKPGSS